MNKPNTQGHAANRIREELQKVVHLREQAHSGALVAAVHDIKQLQARRFRGTYSDFLADPRHAAATRFFLEELYGEHDFAQRDAQFGRIAGAIERLFPQAVADLAIDLAETHALTESLDHEMAVHWMAQEACASPAERYVRCWRQTGNPAQRDRQLSVVQHMGFELQRLTRMRSLRIALKMMRGPAHAAGMGALQAFLERGFDAFATMGDATRFLAAIAEREQHWIQALFAVPEGACSEALSAELDRTS